MKYFGVLLISLFAFSSFGQDILVLKKEGADREHKIFHGTHLKVDINDSGKIKGYFSDWTDSTIIIDSDTILISDISSIAYTSLFREKLSDGLEKTSVVIYGLGVAAMGYFIYKNYDSDPFTLFFGTAGLGVVFSVPAYAFVILSGLVKLKRKYHLNEESGWKLEITWAAL